MYLVPIHVPIFVDGDRKLVTTEWHRSLELLRDSFGGRFGEIAVVAPSLPANSAAIEQALVEVSAAAGDINLYPDFDLRCRARQYWLHHRPPWQAKLAGLVERAEVVHAGLDDIYRPIAFEGFRAGLRFGKPTIFAGYRYCNAVPTACSQSGFRSTGEGRHLLVGLRATVQMERSAG
jgi:hypothetical protein